MLACFSSLNLCLFFSPHTTFVQVLPWECFSYPVSLSEETQILPSLCPENHVVCLISFPLPRPHETKLLGLRTEIILMYSIMEGF